MTTIAELPAGFADKVLSAQSTFRSVMDAMARPGTIQRIAVAAGTPSPLMRGAAAIALTLFDHDTPVWLDAAMSETAATTSTSPLDSRPLLIRLVPRSNFNDSTQKPSLVKPRQT